MAICRKCRVVRKILDLNFLVILGLGLMKGLMKLGVLSDFHLHYAHTIGKLIES